MSNISALLEMMMSARNHLTNSFTKELNYTYILFFLLSNILLGILIAFYNISPLLLISALTLIVISVFSLTSIEFGIIVFSLIYPLHGVIIYLFRDLSSIPYGMINAIKDLIFILILIGWILRIAINRKDFHIDTISVFISLFSLLTLGHMILGFSLSLYGNAIILDARHHIEYILLYPIISTSIIQLAKIIRIFVLQFIVGVLASGIALTSIIVNQGILSLQFRYVSRTVGILGDTAAINTMGIYFALIIIIGITLMMFFITRKNFPFYFFAISILILALLVTYSRRGWFAAFLGVGFVTLLGNKQGITKKNSIIISLLILLIVGISISFTPDIIFRIKQTVPGLVTNSPNVSWQFRIEQFLSLSKSIQVDQFLLGTGIGSTARSYEYSVHNYYMRVLLEMGIVSLFFYFGCLWFSFLLTKRVLVKADNNWVKVISLSGMAIVLLVSLLGVIGETNDAIPIAPLFWSIIGLVGALSRRENMQYESYPKIEEKLYESLL